ncbi:MAG TPA: hypothetical protein DCO75_09165 [Fibrobacteres bacterium]|jgi:CheY-like chemotaxis protein|nr:hypothetical protein [Fibrobacterota bacterium]
MEKSILKDKVILIVDDVKINTEMLSLFVINAGAIPVTASDGPKSIEIVKKQHIDLILMDSNMPVMNGIEATKAIRALPQGENIIIVGIPGDDEKKDIDACLLAGMNMVTAKLALNQSRLNEIAELLYNNSGSRENLQSQTQEIHGAKTNCNGTDFPTINYEKAIKEFENDKDLVDSLIVDFNKNIHSQHSAIKQALGKPDFEFIRMEAHSMKGGAANICAMPLSNAAKDLEASCKQTEPEKEKVSMLIDKLAGEIEEFDVFVNKNIR